MVVVWLLAWGGYSLAQHTRVTAEQVRAYLRATDLSRLSGPARAEALRTLAAMLNALSLEERRAARLDREWPRWFAVMTESERSQFMDATLPTGFHQMLAAFEQMPATKRQQTIDNAVRRLKRAREQDPGTEAAEAADAPTNAPPVLTAEQRQQVAAIGLKAYYSESSAQTKAELAPLL